ncbi:DUF6441 family protein, partial [Mesorhizobium sp.]
MRRGNVRDQRPDCLRGDGGNQRSRRHRQARGAGRHRRCRFLQTLAERAARQRLSEAQILDHAAALIFHNIRYAGIFEEGGTISGKPRLWLPLKDTPKRAGRQKMTPALYIKTIGPLVSIERPG